MADIPIVYCVVPVYNRLKVTKSFMGHINEQDYPAVHTVIVDDGSVDGTGEYLAQLSQSNLTVIKGNGNLWWGGAMHLGMSYVMGVAKGSDYLLMINDDVRIEREYISILVKESITNGAPVVGSSQRDEVTGELLGSGFHIDYWGMRFVPVDCEDKNVTVDALPGRGVLFPMRAVLAAGKINARIFPHFLGDLEYTARVGEFGFKILLSKRADVFSSAEASDVNVRSKGVLVEYFSLRSRNNLFHRILFFSLRGPLLLRIFAVPRYPLTLIAKYIGRLRDK